MSKDNSINPATNLPELPDDCYWNVLYSDGMWDGYIEVRLMRKRLKRNGKEKRPEIIVARYYALRNFAKEREYWNNRDTYNNIARVIQKLAEIARQDFEDAAKMTVIRLVSETFVGDYPPSTLTINGEIGGDSSHE